jgi:RND superfamily putative drug exporter
MFIRLANFTARYKFAIIIFWIALSLVLLFLAPSLSSVGVTDDTQFLPRDTESIQAQKLLEERFPGSTADSSGSAVLVMHNPAGLTESDRQIIAALYNWLQSPSAPPVISRIQAVPVSSALQAVLESADGTTQLMYLSFSVASASTEARQAVEDIRSFITTLPPGPEIYLTGNAGVSADALTSIHQTINKATLVTVLLVVVLLLLIYRSPVAMLVPLLTIGAAYLVARGAAGFIAGAGVSVSSLVDAYLVVTLFGIGTDYCLFMVSRFKEEILKNDIRTAGSLTLRRIGPVILASAATVVVALLCLGISRFGMNRTSGYILAIGVVITLLAGLTLTPALIALLGKKLLWPARLTGGQGRVSGFWHRLGQRVTARPWFFVLPIVIVLLVPYLALGGLRYSSSLIHQMPSDMGSVAGYELYEQHFPTGQMNPEFLLVELPPGQVYQQDYLPALQSLSAELQKLDGVTGVRFFASPAADLSGRAAQVQALAAGLSPATLSQLSSLSQVGQELQDLAVAYPGLVQSVYFQSALAKIQEMSTALAAFNPLTLGDSSQLLEMVRAQLTDIGSQLAALASEFNLELDSAFSAWLKSVYLSADETLVRLDILLDCDPYSSQALDLIPQLRQTASESLSAAGLGATVCYLGGTAADQADILAVNDSDFVRVLILAVAGILIVTAVLLRSLIAPLYMIITVLLNFGATLGISTWLFLDLLHQSALIYMLPIFVFVILVAVGADYNIFLVTRIREESTVKPLKEAIRDSVANTGGVITSCGIILAGTFATLTTASLQMVFQVGAAIAIGVLIDTFLVRAVLIPSLAGLIGRWNWWPSRLFRRLSVKRD